MMDVATIRGELMNYVRNAEPDKIKAVYSLIKKDLLEDNGIWNDDFVKEMDRRKNEFDAGKVQGISWEEVQKNANARLKKIKG